MFENLKSNLKSKLRTVFNRNTIREQDVNDTINQLKNILLDADVNYRVVNTFLRVVKEQTLGLTVSDGLTSSEHFLAIVQQELINLLGKEPASLNAATEPNVILLCGLQGSGKTTTAAKIAYYLKGKGFNPLLAGLDLFRPAAIEQLQILAKKSDLSFYNTDLKKSVIDNALNAYNEAKLNSHSHLILDTQGRLQIDQALMNELQAIANKIHCVEKILVVDAMIGQEALNVAKEFNSQLELTGFIISKMDSDAKGGIMLSLTSITSKQIKFLGSGENITDLTPFDPKKVVANILGLGSLDDMLERIKKISTAEDSEYTLEKIRKNEFTLFDLQKELQRINKIGIKSLIESLPANVQQGAKFGDQEARSFKNMSILIDSMTKLEKVKPSIINGSRKERIANGSGLKVSDVNSLLRKFEDMKAVSKKIAKGKINPANIKNFKFR